MAFSIKFLIPLFHTDFHPCIRIGGPVACIGGPVACIGGPVAQLLWLEHEKIQWGKWAPMGENGKNNLRDVLSFLGNYMENEFK